MLEVTQDALIFSQRLLQGRKVPADVCMRLSRNPQTRLELAPDQKRPSDREFDLEGRTVLVVDQSLADELSDQRVYVQNEPEGEAQLRIERAS
jgi:hypothetical protein